MSRKSIDDVFEEIKKNTPDFDALSLLVDLGELLANKIKELRESKGMTQAQLAEALGTKQSYVCRIEDPDYGKYSLQTLAKVAVALDCDLQVTLKPKSEIQKAEGCTTRSYSSKLSFGSLSGNWNIVLDPTPAKREHVSTQTADIEAAHDNVIQLRKAA